MNHREIELHRSLPVTSDTMLRWLLSDEPKRSAAGIEKHTRITYARQNRLLDGAEPTRCERNALHAMFVDQWSLTRREHRPTRAELIAERADWLGQAGLEDGERATWVSEVHRLLDGTARGALDGSLLGAHENAVATA